MKGRHLMESNYVSLTREQVAAAAAAEHRRSKRHYITASVAITVILTLVLLALFCSLIQPATSDQPVSAVSRSISATPIDAETLSFAYTQNAIRVDAFTRTWLDVKGRVRLIGRMDTGAPYVLLSGENDPWAVQCLFSKESEPVLSRLNPGEMVVIRGICAGMPVIKDRPAIVILGECEVMHRQ
jgi:hypothetical protein